MDCVYSICFFSKEPLVETELKCLPIRSLVVLMVRGTAELWKSVNDFEIVVVISERFDELLLNMRSSGFEDVTATEFSLLLDRFEIETSVG